EGLADDENDYLSSPPVYRSSDVLTDSDRNMSLPEESFRNARNEVQSPQEISFSDESVSQPIDHSSSLNEREPDVDDLLSQILNAEDSDSEEDEEDFSRHLTPHGTSS